MRLVSVLKDLNFFAALRKKKYADPTVEMSEFLCTSYPSHVVSFWWMSMPGKSLQSLHTSSFTILFNGVGQLEHVSGDPQRPSYVAVFTVPVAWLRHAAGSVSGPARRAGRLPDE